MEDKDEVRHEGCGTVMNGERQGGTQEGWQGTRHAENGVRDVGQWRTGHSMTWCSEGQACGHAGMPFS